MPDDSTTDDSGTDEATEVPPDVVDEAERLTRLAREAVDEDEADAYREDRDAMLAEYDFVARVREEGDATLVLHPEEWVEDGKIRTDRIEDLDRGIERPLEGPGSTDDWETVAAGNRDVAATVADEHGPVHGKNAEALADFANNHYAKSIAELTSDEIAEFLGEYFPRNAFPSDDQKAVVEESVRLAVEAAGGDPAVVTGGSR